MWEASSRSASASTIATEVVELVLELGYRGGRVIGRLGLVAQPAGGQLDRQPPARGVHEMLSAATVTASSASVRSACSSTAEPSATPGSWRGVAFDQR